MSNNRLIMLPSLFFPIFLLHQVESRSVLVNSIPFLKDFVSNNENRSVLNFFPCNENDSKIIAKGFKSQYGFLRFSQRENFFVDPVFSNKIIFITDMECSKQIIPWCDSHNLFGRPFTWLFLYVQKSIPKINLADYFQNISILIDSNVIIAGLGENNTYHLIKIFKYRVFSDLQKEYKWTWNPTNHLQLNYSYEAGVYNRRNLRRTILNSCLVITHNDSLNHLSDKRDRHIDSIAKVNYILVQHLADFMNAELEYEITSTWGYKNNESKWGGMIGELIEQRSDIGGTALFMTADRISIIDYLSMTTKTRSKFVFREPKLSYVANVFVLPFNKDVWISTVALVVIVSLVLYATVKWERKKKKLGYKNQIEFQSELKDSAADVIILTFGALCQQATSTIPFNMPGRITTIFLFISLMFLYTSYSANIVALLQSSSKSIQTLEDLLRSRLEVGVDDTVFNHFYFPNATEPIRRAIYQKKVAPIGQIPKYFPIQEGVKKMRQGLFAFHMETGPGYKIVAELFEEGEKCDLQEIQYLQVPDPWLAIQKNSSFKEGLKVGLFLIRETGLQNREIDRIYTKKPVCGNRGKTFISVGLVDCYAPAAIMAGGILVSIILLILELKLYDISRRAIGKKKRKLIT